MTRNVRLAYIVGFLVLVGLFVMYNSRLFEGFRMSEYTTCPECSDDTDCLTCGFPKNFFCDKSKKPGGQLGTCVPRGANF